MQTFVAYTNALELARSLVPIIAALKKHSAEQADQLERAVSSVVLNVAEGARRQGKDPRRFYAFANGSASEIRAVLDLAQALGWSLDDARARQLLDRELGLLWASSTANGWRPANAERRSRTRSCRSAIAADRLRSISCLRASA